MPKKNMYNAAILALSLALSSKAYSYDYGSCPGNSDETCPSVTGNSLQSCANCCFNANTAVMYCGCTAVGYEDPIKCQNSQLEISKCDPNQSITITSKGYLECTYSSQYGGGTYTASETHEHGLQTCPSIPEKCGGPSLKSTPTKT